MLNQVWLADITYIRKRSGWLYLEAVLDLHSRKTSGLGDGPQHACWLGMHSVADGHRSKKPSAWAHRSFRPGTQYASAEHQALLKKYGLVGSMSRKGNCWDNAVMERFFLNLKMERVWQKDYANYAEATNDIADYIVGFYNSIRLHSKHVQHVTQRFRA